MFGAGLLGFGAGSLVLLAMVGLGLATALFGLAPAQLALLRLSGGAAGFFASMIGLYSVLSRSFPTHARATGTGFIMGISRLGSALAPYVAGLLFSGGLGRGGVSILMGLPAVLGAALLASFTVRPPTN